MTYTFTLSDHSSVLNADFLPVLELDKHSRYGLGLLGFYSYNSIFNVDETSNLIGFKTTDQTGTTFIEINHEAYEIEEIHKEILRGIKEANIHHITRTIRMTFFENEYLEKYINTKQRRESVSLTKCLQRGTSLKLSQREKQFLESIGLKSRSS